MSFLHLPTSLKPLAECSQRDISDDQSGSILACLCYTDFCNDGLNNLTTQLTNKEVSRGQGRSKEATRSQVRNKEVSRSQGRSRSSRLCPPGFDLVGGDCYFLSSDRLGWIGAKKQCESRGAQLLSLEEERKRKSLADHINQSSRYFT